jgi:hypothetical protein
MCAEIYGGDANGCTYYFIEGTKRIDLKGSPVNIDLTCVGSREGSHHFQSYVRNLSNKLYEVIVSRQPWSKKSIYLSSQYKSK